jgi:hypothetical protein
LLTRSTPSHPSWTSTWGHALIWMLVTLAALLLVALTAVVDDITPHGALLGVQQGESGSLLRPEDLQKRSADATRQLFMTGERLAGR